MQKCFKTLRWAEELGIPDCGFGSELLLGTICCCKTSHFKDPLRSAHTISQLGVLGNVMLVQHFIGFQMLPALGGHNGAEHIKLRFKYAIYRIWTKQLLFHSTPVSSKLHTVTKIIITWLWLSCAQQYYPEIEMHQEIFGKFKHDWQCFAKIMACLCGICHVIPVRATCARYTVELQHTDVYILITVIQGNSILLT